MKIPSQSHQQNDQVTHQDSHSLCLSDHSSKSRWKSQFMEPLSVRNHIEAVDYETSLLFGIVPITLVEFCFRTIVPFLIGGLHLQYGVYQDLSQLQIWPLCGLKHQLQYSFQSFSIILWSFGGQYHWSVGEVYKTLVNCNFGKHSLNCQNTGNSYSTKTSSSV